MQGSSHVRRKSFDDTVKFGNLVNEAGMPTSPRSTARMAVAPPSPYMNATRGVQQSSGVSPQSLGHRRRHGNVLSGIQTMQGNSLMSEPTIPATSTSARSPSANHNVPSPEKDPKSTTLSPSLRLPRSRRGHSRTQSAPGTELPVVSGSTHEQQPLLAGTTSDARPAPAYVSMCMPLKIEFRDLGLTLKKDGEKRIIQNITGTLFPGTLTTLMGPSGAGKTSLINVLLGRASYGVSSGRILLNGCDQPLSTIRREIGFVPQDDIMHSNLKVREVLYYQAALRLPRRCARDQVMAIVDETIELLELQHVSNSLIGSVRSRGISGGQRKRVNIGMELVADPTLLVLDEPTSGLDSTSGLRVINGLQAAARRKGITIIAVLHQPRYEIFRTCDRVMLLDGSGSLVYEGHTRYCVRYFEKVGYKMPPLMNPADFILDVVSGVIAPHATFRNEDDSKPLGVRWMEHIGNRVTTGTSGNSINGEDSAHRTARPVSQRRHRSFFSQLLTFFRREVQLSLRMAKVLILDVFMMVLGAAFLGSTNINAPLLKVYQVQTLSAIVLGVTLITSSVRVFGMYQTVYWREASSGVNRFAYFLAANLAHIPIWSVSALVYLITLHSLTTPRTGLFSQYSMIVPTAFAVTGLAYMLSQLFTPKSVSMAGVVIVLISAMLDGMNPTLAVLREKFLGMAFADSSFARWVASTMWYLEAVAHPLVYWNLILGLTYHYGMSLENSIDPVIFAVIVLLAYGVVTRILGYLFMIGLNRGKQQ
eukprot:m.113397 g.113397  ORF g.113397 m.113397 type:complete len:761 (-) comp17080_c0_seq3:163-2445(-)